jgi:polyphosphate kinase
MEEETFVNRDLSWLGFNERLLTEADKQSVPLLERINFLSIFSSNLDEFYRVRMPVLMALNNFTGESADAYATAKNTINNQQKRFGEILSQHILPELLVQDIHWIYNKPLPDQILDQVSKIFYTEVLAHISAVNLESDDTTFFAENNKLYLAVIVQNKEGLEWLHFINIPSHIVPRLFLFEVDQQKFVIFLEDILKHHLSHFFSGLIVIGAYNVKITRNAELNLEDEQDEDIIAAVEKELAKRDYGPATRFLYEPSIPLRYVYRIMYALNLENASLVEGGVYHNLKDLNTFPLRDTSLRYPAWPAVHTEASSLKFSIFDLIGKQDFIVHVPYQQYDPVIRFFSEAATDLEVTEIYCSLYRVAANSKIVTALVTAAKNGKKVVVMLELKARFDEANNIKWASELKKAGAKIIYSNSKLKVHAKVALVKRRNEDTSTSYGLLATGNFNEVTAKFYTDHVFFTADRRLLEELDSLFVFLGKKKKIPGLDDRINFEHLLVAQFNLQSRFIQLIDQEISNTKAGRDSGIIIKMNNLEERILISKLYEASRAGVKIQLLIRGICCLVPGVKNQSENITVTRIVDRYLEHGRIFIFHNNGAEDVFMGSSDWMNRNIYSRIEVCFPIYNENLKLVIREMINLQLNDQRLAGGSQKAIYELLTRKSGQN